MIRLQQLKLPVTHSAQDLETKIRKTLRLKDNDLTLKIKRRSLDARKKPELFFVYTIDVFLSEELEKAVCKKGHFSAQKEEIYVLPACGNKKLPTRPVVIGSGPAGLFSAYLLAQKGFCPIVVERGEDVDKRSRRVAAFWEGAQELCTESNVQFGEGGAGTFSDGKLNTLVHDRDGRNRYVLDTFVRFGASEETAYVAKPHLGTDELTVIVKNIRNEIIRLGGTFLFGMKVVDMDYDANGLKGLILEETFTDHAHDGLLRETEDHKYRLDANVAVLAIGHSARDTFQMLLNRKLELQQKNFAVGLRVEHLQSIINQAQYGTEDADAIGNADYKVTKQCENGRSVYSFCMCPGGYVVNASSETGRLAVNGMSYSKRDSANANSALIVSVDQKDFGSDHVLAGLYFQQKLEEKAYEIGKGSVPVQRFADFEADKASDHFGRVSPLVKGKHTFANLRELFPDEINEALIEAIHSFDRQIKGFDDPDAVLSGVESRTSSPVRIVRNEECESIISGLYPCGEGAGYAGGIMSAAMDGMKVAEKIISLYDGVSCSNGESYE